MRVALVMQGAELEASALSRVRYQRLVDAAPDRFALTAVENLADTFDAYVFGKAFQPVVPALSASLAASGKPVILDVCDDYVTERQDVRVQRFVRWHHQMAGIVHAVTAATPALAARLAPFTSRPPIVLGDPAPDYSIETLQTALAGRQPDVRRLHLGWFGIASNPYYSVGVADLAAFAGQLGECPGRHRLTAMTNLSGISPQAAVALSRCPVPVTLKEWSPASEAALLRQVDAAVIPVADQPFSTAKSLNRAVTALVAGTQVLSMGAPVYRDLAPFLYRSLPRLIEDIGQGALRWRASRAWWLASRLAKLASADANVATLERLVTSIRPEPRRRPAVLIGRTDEIAPLASWNGLTIRTPFADPALPADAVLGNVITLSPRAITRLAPDLRGIVTGMTLPANALGVPTPPSPVGRQALDLVRLTRAIPAATWMAQRLFPDHEIIFADAGVLPPGVTE